VISIGFAALISHGTSPVRAQADNAEVAKLRKTVETQSKQIEVLKEKLALQERHVTDLKDFVALMKKYVELKEKEFDQGQKALADDQAKADILIKTYLRKIKVLEGQLEHAKAINEALLEKIRESGGGNIQIDRDPLRPNPPSEQVDGKVEKVDGDIVLINVGSDNGLNKGNTLDVYRREPEAKYLGMIRIMEARPTQSVARLIKNTAPGSAAKLLPGDLVTSKVMLQKKRTEKPDEKTK
jgi:hypothetical protein